MEPPKKILIIPTPRLKKLEQCKKLPENARICIYPTVLKKTNYLPELDIPEFSKKTEPVINSCSIVPKPQIQESNLVEKLVVHLVNEAPKHQNDTPKLTFQAIHRPVIETYKSTTPQNNPFVKFYRCYFCPYRTQLYSYITDHLDLHKTPQKALFACEDTPLQTYKCPRCDLRSVMLFLAIEHLKLKHLEVDVQPTFPKSQVCAWCHCETFSQIILSKHSDKHFASEEDKIKKIQRFVPKLKDSRVVKQKINEEAIQRVPKVPIPRLVTTLQQGNMNESMWKGGTPIHHIQQSIIFQCGRCFYSVVNHQAIIKQHLVSKHLPDVKNQCVVFSYNVYTFEGRLIMRMNIETRATLIQYVKYFQCMECPFQTFEWLEIKKHALTRNVHSFSENTCEYIEVPFVL